MLATLAITGLLGTIAVLWLTVELKSVRHSRDTWRADFARVKFDYDTSVAQSKDEHQRLEQVVAILKSEIATLETEIDAFTEPEYVRDRLRRLLSGAASVSDSRAPDLLMPHRGAPRSPKG